MMQIQILCIKKGLLGEQAKVGRHQNAFEYIDSLRWYISEIF
jgi:hypothetical protein